MSGKTLITKETSLPDDWRGRQVTLLDALLHIRQELRRGRTLWLYTGGDTIDSLLSFTQGWVSCLQFNGQSDPRWGAFLDWLRDVKREAPPEGWHIKLLKDCGGDHARATMRFLDLADEFVCAARSPA